MALVGHWPLTESSGDALDYAGSADGTVNGAVQSPSGLLGYPCYDFDGVDDYVSLPTAAGPSTQEFTLAVWVYARRTGTCDLLRSWGSIDNHIFRFDASRLQLDIKIEGSPEFVRGSKVSTDEWHHLVGLRRGDSLILYADGVEDARQDTPNGTRETGASSFTLGGTNGYYDGLLFDVRVYDHALTAQEIADLAEVGTTASYVSSKQQL